MGRRHHLEQVYRSSIEHAKSYPNLEFVLVDYASQDNLEQWVEKELASELASGLVRCFRTDEPKFFHMSHAKNLSHRLATGDILVNLDADNWFERGFAEEVAALFTEGQHVIARFREHAKGAVGRIAIRRDDFLMLGGYDESFQGWGFEDFDLVIRARRLGLVPKVHHQRHALALQHELEERVRFMQNKDLRSQSQANAARSQAQFKAGIFIANQGRPWGQANVRSVPRLPHAP
jgi:hypothetical protein